MKSLHLSVQFRALNPNHTSSSSSITFLHPCKFNSVSLASSSKPSRLITLCASNSDKPSSESAAVESIREGFLQFQNDPSQSQWNVEVGSPNVPGPSVAKLSLGDQAFFLMAFIACTTSVAFTSLVIAAVPTICAMGRAATSLSKLADTARQELPSTMAAIRLSGMEISDLTLELNDLRYTTSGFTGGTTSKGNWLSIISVIISNSFLSLVICFMMSLRGHPINLEQYICFMSSY
ncbi:hypothetical protein ABKV19_018238 [Rosa sericea]